MVIDSLQDPATLAREVRDRIGVIDVAVTESLYLSDLVSRDELADDALHILHRMKSLFGDSV